MSSNSKSNVSKDEGSPTRVQINSNTNHRTGKNARQKKTDAFRKRVGSKQMSDKRNEIMKKLGIFDSATSELEKSLSNLSITLQNVAIPVPIATRGIGLSSSVEYSRMATTWSLRAIQEICSIHQYYRVSLHLMYYKLYLSQYSQGEMRSVHENTSFFLDEDLRQVVAPITQIPISTYNIITSIGKVDGNTTWHGVKYSGAYTTAQHYALYLYPDNIRDILLLMANANTGDEIREGFYNINPIPGARWERVNNVMLLQNIDQIWPQEYDPDDLQRDIHAYCNLLTRVSGRLPPSFMSSFQWSGVASKTMLASFAVHPTRCASYFTPPPNQGNRHKSKRSPKDSTSVDVTIPAHEHREERLLNSAQVIKVWSPDADITAMELTVGVASFVGEYPNDCGPRSEINGRRVAHISPSIVLSRMVDVPRPQR